LVLKDILDSRNLQSPCWQAAGIAAMMQFFCSCQTRDSLTVLAGFLLCYYCSDLISHCFQVKGSNWLLGLKEIQEQKSKLVIQEEG